jgi:hypothetical protein
MQVEKKEAGVPKALGLTFEQWVNERLGGYVKMSVAERIKAVEELKAEGHSGRDIASVLGVGETSVRRASTPSGAPDNKTANENNSADEAVAPNRAPVTGKFSTLMVKRSL